MATSKRSSSREISRHDVDEQSPLLRPSAEDQDGTNVISPIENIGNEDDYIGEEHEFKSSWYMFLLTLGGFGYLRLRIQADIMLI
jgi:hypothetical protein